MSSSSSTSDMKTYTSSRDQDECQPEPEDKNIYSVQYHIFDTNHQSLVLDQDQFILKAVPRKHDEPAETFDVLPAYIEDVDINPIFLAVLNGELCLCCDVVNEEPTLQLKNINIQTLNSLRYYDRLPFTFLKEKNGSVFTLESMKNPGYFIYTTMMPGQPVGVTKEKDKNNIYFDFEPVNMNLNDQEAK
ncbi:PREDICTED: interleukin-37-like [Dipodomys ordii]|uniref:Interleukin-37-like n=1 Tax=Dipodomys ordii TaxID=10020 RepID=A0A1S3FGI7_DIPOR|nr:PREDICTED: interleukin-37-like [Dipodomys ordii]